MKIDTDEGISGWGEMISGTKTEMVAAGALEMGSRIIGRNPFEIERLWQELYRSFYRGGPINGTIISGIEIALWDIKGKALGVPVYELLGGKAREKLKIYSWIGGDRPSDVAQAAKERMTMGFAAVKMNATEELHYIDSYAKIRAVTDRIEAIKAATSEDFEIAVDFHGRVHKPMAKVLADALSPYHLMFLEEVVLPENEEAFAAIAKYTSCPLAAGERLFTRWQYKRVLSAGLLDIIQPDVAKNAHLNGGKYKGFEWALLSQGDIDYIPVLQSLHACGFDGPIVCEYANPYKGMSRDFWDAMPAPEVWAEDALGFIHAFNNTVQ